MVIKLN